MASISLPDLRTLGLNSLTTNFFPCTSKRHQDLSNIFFKCCCRISSMLHTVSHPISYRIQSGYTLLSQIILRLFSYIFTANIQKSKFTGLYEFFLLPKRIEKWIATGLIHPMYTWDLKKSFQAHKKQSFDVIISGVFDRLIKSNPALIPQGAFEYSFQIFNSDEVQFYSLPAGKIFISSKLLQELDAAIKSQAIHTTLIQLKDGSSVSVNLSTCTMQDVLSALIGHQITHIEESHSIQKLGYHLFSALLKSLLEIFKPSSETIPSMYVPLFSEIFLGIYHLFHAIVFKRHARVFEYTCDIAALYMQQKARFNPLGSLYLMEFLDQLSTKKDRFFLNHFEFLYSRPSFENRKCVLAYCIEKIDPSFISYFELEKQSHRYDPSKEAEGIVLAKELINKINAHQKIAV